jgi:hypothetical protein
MGSEGVDDGSGRVSDDSRPGPNGDRVTALTEGARQALELAVGLGVLGLLRYQSERPRLEEELDRVGLTPAANLIHQAGDLLDRGLRQVMSSLVR